MKMLFAIILMAMQDVAMANGGIDFELIVSPLEWKVPSDKETFPILIVWKVKNTTDHRLILPIGSSTKLELIDSNGKRVPGGESRDGMIPFSDHDYRLIKPRWSTYVSAGDLSLYSINHEIFIGGQSARGGWIDYGPIAPGKYKLRCIFSTDEDPSDFAKKHWSLKNLWLENLWLGQFTSAWIPIVIR